MRYAAEAALHDAQEFRRAKVAPCRIRVETAKREPGLICAAAEHGIQSSFHYSCSKSAMLQPLGANARLVATDARFAKDQAGLDVFGFNFIEVVENDFDRAAIWIWQRGQ